MYAIKTHADPKNRALDLCTYMKKMDGELHKNTEQITV